MAPLKVPPTATKLPVLSMRATVVPALLAKRMISWLAAPWMIPPTVPVAAAILKLAGDCWVVWLRIKFVVSVVKAYEPTQVANWLAALRHKNVLVSAVPRTLNAKVPVTEVLWRKAMLVALVVPMFKTPAALTSKLPPRTDPLVLTLPAVLIVNWPVVPTVTVPPLTFKVLPIVVAPFKLTAPVPVLNEPLPVCVRLLLFATATPPLKVAVPVKVLTPVTAKVPPRAVAPVLTVKLLAPVMLTSAAKLLAPADTVKPLLTLKLPVTDVFWRSAMLVALV